MISPEIVISNASLTYHRHLLFNQLSITFPSQQWSGLLGPSGVGKSSLIRLIAGLPTGGKIDAATVISPSEDKLKQQISYMCQHNSLMPWLSTLENVLLGYRLRQQSIVTVKQQAIELLNRVGLQTAIKKRPQALSGGMKQRVALVRTLLENKPIVLMDEPFSALDVVTRLKLQELAYELLRDKTVILVTHDPLEALRLCDHIYVMAGQPAQVQNPIHPQGPAPRDPDDPNLLELQGVLLRQLRKAAEEPL